MFPLSIFGKKSTMHSFGIYQLKKILAMCLWTQGHFLCDLLEYIVLMLHFVCSILWCEYSWKFVDRLVQSHIYLFDSILAYPIQLFILRIMNMTYDNECDVEWTWTKLHRENWK